ncbi:hypothetical protein Efla_007834 [Eimeria flavescens]
MAPKKAARAANGGKKARAKKDPDAPKRGTPAYIYFMQDKREEICRKNPTVKSATEIAALVGDEWKKLTPSQKAPYEKKAEADKLRYQKEIAAYKKKKAAQRQRGFGVYAQLRLSPRGLCCGASGSVLTAPERCCSPVLLLLGGGLVMCFLAAAAEPETAAAGCLCSAERKRCFAPPAAAAEGFLSSPHWREKMLS